jgi:hypothetical protein
MHSLLIEYAKYNTFLQKKMKLNRPGGRGYQRFYLRYQRKHARRVLYKPALVGYTYLYLV